MKIVVGKAKFTDIFRIETLLNTGREEMEKALPPADLPHAYHVLLDMIAGGLTWVARDEDDSVVGVIVLEPHRMWFKARAHYLESVEFYVAPEFRKGGVAAKLIDKAKEAAATAAIGGVPLVMSLTSGRMAEMKDRFVEGQGFTYLGGSLMWELPPPEPAQEEAVPDEEGVAPELEQAV